MHSVERFEITTPGMAERVLELQQAAYAVEAELIGFDGIPPLHESVADVLKLDFVWFGAFERERLLGALACRHDGAVRDIDRLFVDPAVSRSGIGRSLVIAALDAPRVSVSTGTKNLPAVRLYESLGFVRTGARYIASGVAVTMFERQGGAADA